MRIAFLGTGLMGAPMARRLVEAGHEVRAWNRTREKADGLGAEVVGTPAEAVADVELVVTMLADGPTAESVVEQAGPSFPAGATWAQTSTIGLEWTRRLAAVGERHRVRYVDAPVLGTKGPAEQGQLVLLGAGPEDARAVLEEVAPAISRKFVWLGEEIGSASALKLVLNHWIQNSVENIAETIALAQALGVEPRLFLDSISGGQMDMQYIHFKTEAILSGNLEPSFTLKLAAKDMGLIVSAAREAGLALGLGPVTLERMKRGVELGHGDEDMAATYYATRDSG